MPTDWGAIMNLAAQGIGAAGQVAAARSAGRAAGRQQEASNNMAQDEFGQTNYRAQQDASINAGRLAEQARLDRAKLGIEAPAARTGQALWGDLIQHMQDAKIEGLGSHIPQTHISGGMRPSAISQAGRNAAGGALQTQAMQALLSGSDVPAMPDFSKLVLTPPDATPLPQASGQDSFLNTLATIGAAAQGGSALYDEYRKRNAAAPIATNNTGAQPFAANTMRGVSF